MQSLNITARPNEDSGSETSAIYTGGAMRFGARRRYPLLLSILLGLLILSPSGVRAQSVIDAFDPGDGPTETVRAVAVQPDGRVLIGGQFTGVAGYAISGVARLNAGGTVDPSFQPQTNGTVHALAVQADGKVLVGGSFAQVGGQPHSGIARVNADGTLDSAFNPGVEGTVFSVIVLRDGKVLIGGFFSKVGGQTRYCVARLNADGTLDAAFDTGGWANGYVFALAENADGTLLVGGQFTYLGGQERAYLAKLGSNGEASFYSHRQVNGAVYALSVRPDGKVLVGGDFTRIGWEVREHLARFNPDGTLDDSFRNGANDSVRAIATRSDGRTLVGGLFTQVNGQARNRFARFNADGTLDIAYNPEPNGPVHAIGGLDDGRAFIAGEFTEAGGQGRRRVARLIAGDSYTDYSNIVDPSFKLPSAGWAMAMQPDGRILASGVTGQSTHLTRFNVDGTIDQSFNCYVGGGEVHAIAVQPDGRIIIGGRFRSAVSYSRPYLARLHGDGSLDDTFAQFTNSFSETTVNIIALQPDGKILVAGTFTKAYGHPYNHFVRLNADGTRDESFNPNPDKNPTSLALQTDGKILLGGGFSRIGGQERRGVTRLNADGTLDTTFNPNVGATAHTMAVQPDGRILIGGLFEYIGGIRRPSLARLKSDGTLDDFKPWGGSYYAPFSVTSIALQTNGKMLISGPGNTSYGVRYMRLNADGTADASHNSYRGSSNSFVLLQPDGRPLLGMSGLKRLLNNEAAQQQLSVKLWANDTASIHWERSGAAPEVERVVFEVSTDGHTYNTVGEATRGAGGWVLHGASLPLGRSIYVRARGIHMATGYVAPHTYSTTAIYDSVLHLILYPNQTDGPPTF